MNQEEQIEKTNTLPKGTPQKAPSWLFTAVIAVLTLLIGAGGMYIFLRAENLDDSDTIAIVKTTPSYTVTPNSTTPIVSETAIVPLVTKILESTGRTAISFDLNKYNGLEDYCKGLILTANVPAGTTMTSHITENHVEGCVNVTLKGADYELFAYVGDAGVGCMDMQGAIEIGKLSNGQSLYRKEQHEDFEGNGQITNYYSYHTVWNKTPDEPSCTGATSTAFLNGYDALVLSCMNNTDVCDEIVKSIQVNVEMN